MTTTKRIFTLAAILAYGSTGRAALHLPAVFGDHMVLQSGAAAPVWGSATPGSEVNVRIGTSSATAKAGPDGAWEARLPALKADAAPLELVVEAGGETVRCKDVLIGEVWVCAGQSNMEFRLNDDADRASAVTGANEPRLRYFQVKNDTSAKRERELTGKWVVCTPQSAVWFSAVAFYFGIDLTRHVGAPVGLIGSQWGATWAASWMSREGLAEPPAFDYYLQRFETGKAMLTPPAPVPAGTDQDARRRFEQWQASAIRAKQEGKPIPPRPADLDLASAARSGPLNVSPNDKKLVPTALFNAMVAPLIPYAIRGVIWYQGESNAGDNDEYYRLFPRLIRDWRANWGQGDFPFLFVQLPNYNAGLNTWPLVRDAQFHALGVPNTGMAITLDLGTPASIHPPNKAEVGARLARLARATVYGEKIVPTGPLFAGFRPDGKRLRVSFSNAAGGLRGKGPDGVVEGCEIAGADGRWTPARAMIEGEELVVWSDAVPSPAAVRYAWLDNPSVSLFNSDRLPASPFSTKTAKPQPTP